MANEELLPDWSPDGKRIVFTTRGGPTEPLYVFDLKKRKARQSFSLVKPRVSATTNRRSHPTGSR